MKRLPFGFTREEEGRHPASPLSVPVIFEPATRARWEYRTVGVDPREEGPLEQEQLNPLGDEGWILVAVVATRNASGAVTRQTYYFIRAT